MNQVLMKNALGENRCLGLSKKYYLDFLKEQALFSSVFTVLPNLVSFL
jgi:hypothetical protein